MDGERKLTAKQRAFVREYMIDRNATKACIRAGYSAANADKIGSELLRKTRVAEELRKAEERYAAKKNITAERIIDQYIKIAFAEIEDHVQYGPNGVKLRDSRAKDSLDRGIVSEINQTDKGIRIKMHSKTEALNALASHLNLLHKDGDVTEELTAILKSIAGRAPMHSVNGALNGNGHLHQSDQ